MNGQEQKSKVSFSIRGIEDIGVVTNMKFLLEFGQTNNSIRLPKLEIFNFRVPLHKGPKF